jgi:chitodextrinase
VKVTVGSAVDTQPPTSPTLISATAASATEVDLLWTASTDNTGIAGYQIIRNGSVIGSVPGATLNWADRNVNANATYIYTVKADDAAGNYSGASNSLQITTPAVLSSSTCPAPAASAFTGCYYSNTTLSGDPVFIRTDPEINFYWGNSSPDRSLPPLGFSARWQGNFTFSPGTYTFTVVTSDGMRLYFDGNLIIDNWRDQPPYAFTAKPTISSGTHLITVEYYERLGGATAQVSWQKTSSATPAAPVISSFTAIPSNVVPGQPVNLSWAVSGAASISIDNGVGNVTSLSTATVSPAQTTIYTLTASNSTDTSTATVKVTVGSAVDTQPPTPPTLISATAASPTEVNLLWTASTDNTGIAGYQIIRNGSVIGSVPGATLNWVDTNVNANATYTYAVKADDAAGNYSGASNSVQITTPAAATTSVSWLGACWEPLTISGVTGNFQAIDFVLTTSTPVPIQGTLFFAPNCDASQGTDNMNDFNTLTGSTHMIRGFTHFPDVIPTSAYYWAGPRTDDGKCAPGSPCSGCVNYNKATPVCSALP